MGAPLITVVVPVYNAEKYLDECVKSMLAQSYTNWELILVNDGSADGSPALCDGWQSRDERIRAIHKANGGVSSARNAGMDVAKGEYLAFVDADDWVEPEYLQVLYQTLGQTDLAICCVFDESDWNEKVCSETVAIERIRTTPSQYANPVYTNYACNKLFRLARIRNHKIRWPVGVKRCEDAYFVADYLLQCDMLAVSNQKLYHYPQREGSAMHRFYAGVCADELPLMDKQYNFFHKFELPQEEENAYRLWEYGKIISVLRYIAMYASGYSEKNKYISLFIAEPSVKMQLEKPPKGIGKKGKLVSALLKAKCVFMLPFVFKYY